MPENDRGIGSEGLEQGGPNLGNDYSRSVGTRGNTGARDAIIVPNDEQTENRSDDTLNMDNESSRNLSGELTGTDVTGYNADLEDDTDDDDDEMMEDDVLQGLDTDDDDDDDEDDENDII
jgi:hypothetical protein